MTLPHRRPRRTGIRHGFRARVLLAMLAVALPPLAVFAAVVAADLRSLRQSAVQSTNSSILDDAEQAQGRVVEDGAAGLNSQLAGISAVVRGLRTDAAAALAAPVPAPVPPAPLTALNAGRGGGGVAYAPDGQSLLVTGGTGAGQAGIAAFAAATRSLVDGMAKVQQADQGTIESLWIEDAEQYALRTVPGFDLTDTSADRRLTVAAPLGPGDGSVFRQPASAAADDARGRLVPAFGDRTLWTRPYPLLHSGQAGITVWLPVDPDGRYRVGADVPVGRLRALLPQTVTGVSGGYTLLLSPDGSLLGTGGDLDTAALAHDLGVKPQRLASALDSAAVDPLGAVVGRGSPGSGGLTVATRQLAGVGKAVVAAQVPEAQWTLASVVPLSTLLPEQAGLNRGVETSVRHVLLQAIPIAVILSLVAVLLANLLARRVVGPLGAVTAAAERLGAGRIDEPVPPQGSDEVGLLADALERMRREVSAGRDTILAAARELEGRVAERTAELRSRNEELVALNRLAAGLTRSLDPPVLLAEALTTLGAIIPLSRGRGYLLVHGHLRAIVSHPDGAASAGPLIEGAGAGVGSAGPDARAAIDWSAGPAAAEVVATDGGREAGELLAGVANDAVDAGEVVVRDEAGALLVGLPLATGEGPQGAIALLAAPGGWLGDRGRALLRSVSDQVGLALRTAALSAEGRELAVLEERTRLAREIHDTMAQQLTAIVLQLEAAEAFLARDGERARRTVVEARELARQSLAEARRSVWNLRPAPLDATGLAGAIRVEADRQAQLGGRPIRVVVEKLPRDLALAPEAEVAVFRIVQEALANAAGHSGAEQIDVRIGRRGDELLIAVSDDGGGFDTGAPAPGRFGLVGMAERARLVGAELRIRSRPGAGTRVELRLPLSDRVIRAATA